MPNWCEGSLKLKGEPDKIRKFLIDRVLYTDVEDVKENTISDKKVDDDEIYFEIIGWRWVKNTRRAFLTPQFVYYEDCGVISLNMSQAWGFKYDDWLNVSKEYDLEVKLCGVEQGGQFTDYVHIKDGEISNQKSDTYETFEDWLWNVPFPNMGG